VCNLYSLSKKRDAVARFFRVSHNHTGAFEPLPAIFPGHVVPVLRQGVDGDREIVTMSWGFVLHQKDDLVVAMKMSGIGGTADRYLRSLKLGANGSS